MAELIVRVNVPREMAWLEEFKWKGTVILPAHILEVFKKRCASMLRTLACPYVVDPHTYVFGSDTGGIVNRRWFDRLVAEYGMDMMAEPYLPSPSPGMLVEEEGGRPTGSLRELVRNVLAYQRNVISDAGGETGDYEDFEAGGGGGEEAGGEDSGGGAPGPRWIIPPYFYVESAESGWLDVNVRSIELAAGSAQGGDSLHAMIMVSQDLLSDADAVEKIASAYAGLPVAGYVVWAAGMDEARADASELADFRGFIDRLSGAGRPVYNAYGGLFSLANDAIRGTSHSICYGEHRTPFETAGGGFSVRFYLPGLYAKVPYGRAPEISDALALGLCRCRYCARLGGRPAQKKMEHAALHFLECRTRDLELIERSGGDAFIDRLKSASDEADRRVEHREYSRYHGHFKTWKDAVSLHNARKGGGGNGPA